MTTPKQGVVFPFDANGRRSTSAVGKHVVSAALGATDAAASGAVASQSNWRKNYGKHFLQLTRAAAQSVDAPVAIARTGLKAAYEQFRFARDGETRSLPNAMASPTSQFTTKTLAGEADRRGAFAIPYRGQLLSGTALEKQLTNWEGRGIIEPTHGDAIRWLIAHPDALDLRDLHFALLGSGAEVGPRRSLLNYGANVIAVDLPRESIWGELRTDATRRAGRLIYPTRADTEQAGADLLTDTPEIAQWLIDFDRPLVVGTYAYLDGAKHAEVVMAMDAIVDAVLHARSDASLSLLLTPSDAYLIPAEAAMEARRQDARFRGSLLWRRPARWLTFGNLHAPNASEFVTINDREFGLVDSIIPQQGPNYALAKRIQQWRAIQTRADRRRVSANVAPSARTQSVVSNRLFAAGFNGTESFGCEIFDPPTANALMAGQLIYDQRCSDSVANPNVELTTPLELFMSGANHGGFWRMPEQARSVLPAAVVLGFLGGGR